LSEILDIAAIVNVINNQERLNIQNLILIPHRDLHRFPIHALFPNNFTITYLPSAKIGITLKILQSTNVEKIHELPLLSVEHPDSKGYPPLEFAQVESESISRMFTQHTRKSSEQATKAAVIEALPHNRIFHFTGHGEYNFDHPTLSNLALAGEDKLTVEDICNFDLTNYQLISLAACETAITGNRTITAEYVGLVSGFMAAGVRHVVSTLWTVESEATALVMIQFYQLLQQEKTAEVALAEATQWLRNIMAEDLAAWYAAEMAKLPEHEDIIRPFLSDHSDILKNTPNSKYQPYNHPYFWAAFTITGNSPSCNH
jgi:CHAT domain-containing protein